MRYYIRKVMMQVVDNERIINYEWPNRRIVNFSRFTMNNFH